MANLPKFPVKNPSFFAKDAVRPPQPKMKVRAPQYIRARTTKQAAKGK